MTLRTKVKGGIAFLIIAILGTFLILNREIVEVNLIVGSIKMNLAVLIFAIFILGFLLGWIFRSILKVNLPRHSED